MNVISNDPADAAEIVAALIAAPEVRHISFTGSTSVGRIIAVKAAEQLKPVPLELGGKAPLVILDDADIGAAVNGAAFGSFMNQGQICMSTERAIVHEGIAGGQRNGTIVEATLIDYVTPNMRIYSEESSGRSSRSSASAAIRKPSTWPTIQPTDCLLPSMAAISSVRWVTIEDPHQHFPF